MENSNNLQLENNMTVMLVSEANELGEELINTLMEKNFSVIVFTKEKQGWIKTVEKNINNLRVINLDEMKKEMSYRYLIINNYHTDYLDKDFEKILERSYNAVKKIVLLPFQVESQNKKDQVKSQVKLSEENNIKCLLVGDLISRHVYNNGTLIDNILSDFINNRIAKDNEGAAFYLVPCKQVSDETVKSLLSFSGTGVRSLISQPILYGTLKTKLQKYLTNPQYISGENINRYFVTDKHDAVLFQHNLDGYLEERKGLVKKIENPNEILKVPQRVVDVNNKAAKMVINDPRKVKIEHVAVHNKKTVKRKFPVIRIKRLSKKNTNKLLLSITLLITVPVVSTIISMALTFLSLLTLQKGSLNGSKKLDQFASIFTAIPLGECSLFSKVPLLGGVFYEPLYFLKVVDNTQKSLERVIGIGESTRELAIKITGKEPYDVNKYAGNVSLEMDKLYQESSFMQSEIESAPPLTKKIIISLIKEEQLSQIREKIRLAQRIYSQLPDILGKDNDKTYLVLLQNNMELRPTGGFIGSFALVSFSGGRLSNVNIQDVYEADGQLQGYVDPPAPIKKYLNGNGWFLRDSNWDPDFSISAKRAEWFLDKEIDNSVDGVIGIDLELIKNMLGILGPVKMSEFNQVINTKNMYEITQTEVESDFFPGSQKKTAFLSSLGRSIMDQVVSMKQEYLFPMSKLLLSSLEEKHVQLYFHNQTVQQSLHELGFDGAVVAKTCTGNCYYDRLGLVEANLGVNKSNYYISRKLGLDINIGKDVLVRTLRIEYKNNANPALGEKGAYKTYSRLLLPQDSTVKEVSLTSKGKKQILNFSQEGTQGRKEVGVYYVIASGESGELDIIWEGKPTKELNTGGEYDLLIRKQAGTIADPLRVNIKLPSNLVLSSTPDYSLTGEGTYSYNTTLLSDYVSRIIW